MGKIGFAPGQGKNNFYFSFSSFYALKQTKECILFQANPLKILNLQKFGLILGLQAKFVAALILTSFFLFSKITPPYCT